MANRVRHHSPPNAFRDELRGGIGGIKADLFEGGADKYSPYCRDCGRPLDGHKVSTKEERIIAALELILVLLRWLAIIAWFFLACLVYFLRALLGVPGFLIGGLLFKSTAPPTSNMKPKLPEADSQGQSKIHQHGYSFGSWQYEDYSRWREYGMTPAKARDMVEREARWRSKYVAAKKKEASLDAIPPTHTGNLAEKPAGVRNQRDRVQHNTSAARRMSDDSETEEYHYQIHWDEPSTDGICTPAPKVKVKSRRASPPQHIDIPEPICFSETSPESSPNLSPRTPPSPIPVSQASRELFIKMMTCNKDSKRPVKFDDLTIAMVDAGFTVINGSGGSSIKFIKDGVGSTSFHRPHDGRIQYDKLRTWGRRFKREFGWDEHTFLEREE